MTSLTSVCEPNPTARPTTPAPASSGPIFTPISDSTIKPTIVETTTSRALRNRGSRVFARALSSTSPSSLRAKYRSMTDETISQNTTAMTITNRLETALPTMRRPVSVLTQANESTPHASSIANTATVAIIAVMTTCRIEKYRFARCVRPGCCASTSLRTPNPRLTACCDPMINIFATKRMTMLRAVARKT